MTASTLYLNGHFYTVDAMRPGAEAMLVRDGVILAIGSLDEVRLAADGAVATVDLGGRFVMPAFTDAHLHFAWGAQYLNSVGLRDATSMAEVISRLETFARTHPDLPWILGSEFSYGYPDLADSGFHRSMFDAVVADRPVYFKSGMAHAAWANSRALELAGISRDTPDPVNGEIVRDGQGEPTGWLKEHAARPLDDLVPPPTPAELLTALKGAMREANRLGISRVQSAGFDDEMVPLLDGLLKDDALTLRFTLSSIVDPDGDAGAIIARVAGWRASLNPDFLDARVIKFFLDGVLESHTGYMPDGYADRPEEKGICLWDVPAYYAAVAQAQENGFQVWTHAIGTGAIAMALDAYQADGALSRIRRPRVEHAEIPTEADIRRFAAIGAIASLQPAMIYPRDQWLGMEGIWEMRAGRQALARAFPLRSLLDAGAALAFGTDWPIVDLNPLVGIRNAVMRQSLDHQPPGGWVPAQAITVAEAIHAYTLGAAYAGHRETFEGSLAVGKFADFIVLSDNPLAIDPDGIAGLRVLKTVVNGRLVWDADAA